MTSESILHRGSGAGLKVCMGVCAGVRLAHLPEGPQALILQHICLPITTWLGLHQREAQQSESPWRTTITTSRWSRFSVGG